MSKRKASKKRWAHLRKFQFKRGRKKRRKSTPVAKRRRKSRAIARRSKHHFGRRRRRRGSSGGSSFGLMPGSDEMKLMGASAVYGFLEEAASSDASHILNKIPRPVAQLGYTGGTALALRVLAHFTKNPWLRIGARATAVVATYQMGRKKGLFTDASKAVTMSGDDDMSGDEHFIDDRMMGALDAEGSMMSGDDLEGVQYDDSVLNQ